LSIFLELHNYLLNIFIPGYGRMSAGGGFALLFGSLCYFGINAIVILLSLFYFKKKIKETIP